jgi:hypothetical protein
MKPPQIQLTRQSDLLVLRLQGDYTLEAATYVQGYIEELSNEYGYRLILIDVSVAGTITHEARRYLLANRSKSRHPSVVAVIGGSFTVRTLAHMVLTALRTMTKTNVNMDFFGNEHAARLWIETQRNRLRKEMMNH